MDTFIQAGKHFDSKEGLGSYVAPFFAGEKVCHAARREDIGEYFWDREKSMWISCSKKLYFQDGTVTNVAIPDDAKMIRLQQWRFFVLPDRLSAEVQEFFQRSNDFYDLRDRLPALSWVVNMQGEAFCSCNQQGGSCKWVYYEHDPRKFEGQGDRSWMGVSAGGEA